MSFIRDAIHWLADVLSPFPDWLVVLIVAMLPIMELRGSIPLGIGVLGMPWPLVLTLSIVGNLVVIPFIWWLLQPIEDLIRRWPRAARRLDRIYSRTRRRSRKRIETYEELALFAVVVIPLPGTGAWTSALLAHLFDLPRVKAFWFIAAGILVAGLLFTMAMVTGMTLSGL